MKAVLLDRDGTLIKEKGYITSAKQVEIFSTAPKALRKLAKAGFKLIIFTNQGAIAKGLITEKELAKINNLVDGIYKSKGVKFEKIYYCPHHPEGTIAKYTRVCGCRKPATGMLKNARRDFNIDFKKSFVIGDTMRDMESGYKMGAKTILVLTGYGRKIRNSLTNKQRKMISHVARNISSAAKWILGRNNG
jgi:D-glycero-D-manno-heptose 1,7-bisphosphate phosphatase